MIQQAAINDACDGWSLVIRFLDHLCLCPLLGTSWSSGERSSRSLSYFPGSTISASSTLSPFSERHSRLSTCWWLPTSKATFLTPSFFASGLLTRAAPQPNRCVRDTCVLSYFQLSKSVKYGLSLFVHKFLLTAQCYEHISWTLWCHALDRYMPIIFCTTHIIIHMYIRRSSSSRVPRCCWMPWVGMRSLSRWWMPWKSLGTTPRRTLAAGSGPSSSSSHRVSPLTWRTSSPAHQIRWE